jgi:hypothetical protein
MPFIPVTRRLTGEFTSAGPVDVVFNLFSPLGEKSWVPEWDPELLHPPGVTWERGLIFRTKEDRSDAIWIVTHLDHPTHHVEYHRVESNRYLARVEVQCTALSAVETVVETTYEFVGLSNEGNEEISAMTEDGYRRKMTRWRDWIEAYLMR